jgi:hypothetical protein
LKSSLDWTFAYKGLNTLKIRKEVNRNPRVDSAYIKAEMNQSAEDERLFRNNKMEKGLIERLIY